MRDIGSVAEVDLTQLHLDVYDTRDGPWHPEHGALAIPESWRSCRPETPSLPGP
jgi:hypothetical protein